MQSFVSHYGYFGLFLISILSSACLPIPSEVAYGFAGALCAKAVLGHSHLNFWGVVVFATIGSVIGSVIAYEVGRSAGRTIVDRWGKWLLLSHKDLDDAERWFARYGAVSVLVGRVIPVVRSFISVPAGLAEMKRGPYLALTTLGCAAWVVLVTELGDLAGANWTKVSHDFKVAEYPVAALLVLGLGWAFWHRWRSVRADQHRHSA